LAKALEEENKVKLYGSETLDILSDEIDSEVVTKKIYSKSNPLSVKSNELLRYLEFFKFRKDIKDFGPDLIITQLECIFLSAYLASKLNCKHAFFIRSYHLTLDEIGFEGSSILSSALNFSAQKVKNKILDYSFKRSNLIVANSKFMAQNFSEKWGIEPEVIYPLIEEEDYLVSDELSREKILHVNPSQHKGIDITLEVAESSEEEFMIAGNKPCEEIMKKLDQLENVEYIGFKKDMKEVYKKTKLVLMPSMYEEPFGRLPVEAGLNGIPTICSGRGGLKESIPNNSFCVKSNNPQDYLEKIKEVNNDYKSFCKTAKNDAKGKTASAQIEKFCRIITQKLDLELS